MAATLLETVVSLKILVLLTLYTVLLPFKVTGIANKARQLERLFSVLSHLIMSGQL